MAYIDRDKFYNDMLKRFGGVPMLTDHSSSLRHDIHLDEALDMQPTADVVEVKHGEWIIDNSIEERTFYDTNYKILITCNICGSRHFLGTQPYRNFTQDDLKEDAYRKYRYCGECGAKMDGNNLSTIPTGSEGRDT